MKNEFLFQKVKELVATERRISVEILELLYEIEKRKAYAELRYDGLYTYCVKELGFTDAQAYQRIQAMRALKEVPELKTAIQSGALSVSSVSKVQTHLRQERKKGKTSTKDQKLALFRSVENYTSREVDAKLSEVRGEAPKKKLVLELDSELEALWNQARDLAAHRSRGDDAEVLRVLASEWIARNHPLRKEAQTQKRAQTEKHDETSKPDQAPEHEQTEKPNPVHENPSAVRHTVPWSTRVAPRRHSDINPAVKDHDSSRFISAALKRAVWRKHSGKCALCGSAHALEIDHILPFAKGGATTEENLRLLCRSCNRFAAVHIYGAEKIERYTRPQHS
jgi:hypothetical protein